MRIPASAKFCPECGKKQQETNITKKPIDRRRQTATQFSPDSKQEEKPVTT
jgi:hypothetical protein